MTTFYDRARGCMLGSAIGDALGADSEFKSWASIVEAYGEDGVQDIEPSAFGRAGLYTDDTQNAIAIARGILEAEDHGFAALDRAYRRQLLAWYESQRDPFYRRAPGSTCMSACGALARGAEVANDSYGNGATMRVHPVAIAFVDARPGLLVDYAAAQARVTHRHHAAGYAAGFWALVLQASLLGRAPTMDLFEVSSLERMRHAQHEGGDVRACIERGLRWRMEGETTRELANDLDGGGMVSSWGAPGATAQALAICHHHAADFEAGVLAAANIDGDSDTVATMVGAVLGACNPDQIPDRWLNRLENRRGLEGLAHGLALTARPGALTERNA